MSTATALDSPIVRRASRSHAIDLVRVLGVTAIIAGHTWVNAEWVSRWLFTWHVPVFFIISGYLWSEGRTTATEIVKRGRTLLLPYIVWLVLVTVVWLGFRSARGDVIDWAFLPNIVRGGWFISRPFSAFWFVTALFVATVLMRWLSNVSPVLPWFVGGLGVAWAIVDPVGIKQVPEAAGLALPAVFFLCVGWLLRGHRSDIPKPAAFGLVLLVPALLLASVPSVAAFNMKSGVLGTPVLGVLLAAAISCGLILLCEAAGPLIPERVGRAVTVVAEVGLPMILGHALVLWVAESFGMVPSKTMFLLAFLIPLAFGLAVRATPLRRFFM